MARLTFSMAWRKPVSACCASVSASEVRPCSRRTAACCASREDRSHSNPPQLARLAKLPAGHALTARSYSTNASSNRRCSERIVARPSMGRRVRGVDRQRPFEMLLGLREVRLGVGGPSGGGPRFRPESSVPGRIRTARARCLGRPRLPLTRARAHSSNPDCASRYAPRPADTEGPRRLTLARRRSGFRSVSPSTPAAVAIRKPALGRGTGSRSAQIVPIVMTKYPPTSEKVIARNARPRCRDRASPPQRSNAVHATCDDRYAACKARVERTRHQ